MNDFLEHIKDPEDILELVKTKFSSKGILIASIPNFLHISVIKNVFLKKDFEYSESGVLDRGHLRFFTKKSMKRLFCGAGYEVKMIKGINCQNNINSKFVCFLSLGHFRDSKCLQYALTAYPKKSMYNRQKKTKKDKK